jgi:hypothetical protein
MKSKIDAKPAKPIMPRDADTKYMGNEPQWTKLPQDDAARRLAQLHAFAWYNYYCDSKDAKKFVIDWMGRNEFPAAACQRVARSNERNFSTTPGWLCRMNVMGWPLDERERRVIADHIQAALQQGEDDVQVQEKPAAPRPNIQDRLREKMLETGGDIEGLFDSMILAGAKMTADIQPMTILRERNVVPQMVGEIAQHWRQVAAELQEAAQGRDADLVEGYGRFSKIQVRNMVRFAEQVVADCASYVQVKKVERKPRKKKPVSPEKLTARFKYLREFAELGLKSVPVTDLVDAQEAWLYDTRRRKLIYVVHEDLLGSFSVKGTGLIGYDTTKSVRKTLRKPKEQLKSLMSGGAPAARKVFREIRSTETKFNGRGNADMIILRVR